MSQCMTCRYALYDGMCLAKGKFTTLDAPACDTYAAHADVEASRLRAENAKLRQLVRDMHKALFTLDIDYCQACPRDNVNGPCTKFMVCGGECSIEKDMRDLKIEV